ncbi:MAG: glycosyltransferase family 39 protein [Flavobacteriales bacterium]|nr:glycosyltransferase family 39 protein [Flavobacteriales bacterium]
MERTGKSIPVGWWLPLLVLVAVGLHWRALPFSFFSDDFSVIHKLGTRDDLSPGSFFRPLPDWTLWLQYRVHGPKAWAFRLVNVLLLGLNGWLVTLLARKLMCAEATLLAGMLFVLYPFHLEPQVWIIGRSTAMSTLFILLALHAAAGELNPWRKSIGVFMLGSLGALCYESALLLPLLLAAWLIMLRPADMRGWGAAAAASAIAVALHLLVRALAINRVANDYGSGFFNKPMSDYLGMVAKVIGRSLLPPNEDPAVQTVCFAMLFVVLAVVAIGFWRASRAEPQARRIALLLVSLFGTASIIAIVGGVSTRTSESDRFLYLPSAFLCMLIALLMARLRHTVLRRSVIVLLSSASLFMLKSGQENWRIASWTIERLIAETPEPPPDGRLLVWNLPSDHNGAFIFRHGFREALVLAGRDASRVRITPEGPDAIGEYLLTETGDTLHRSGNDRWFDAGVGLRRSP